MNSVKQLIQIIRKKIIFILLVGIASAILISSVKFMFSDIAQRHGDYLFIRTVQVESIANTDNKDNFDYKGFLESPSNYYQFMRAAEKGDFDFTIIDSAWKRKSPYEQISWLKKKFQVVAFRDNVFEVSIHFDANATRDVNYMKDHGELLIDDFISQSEKSIQSIKPSATFKIISKESFLPVVEPINRQIMIIKFAGIGFIIGIIGSSFCFFLWEVAKENRKRMN